MAVRPLPCKVPVVGSNTCPCLIAIAAAAAGLTEILAQVAEAGGLSASAFYLRRRNGVLGWSCRWSS